MTTTFQVPIPPSVNALYKNVRGRGRAKTERYRIWIQAAASYVLEQKPQPTLGWIAVEYRIPWFKDKRRRDLGNFEKAISDLLVRHELIEDDSKIIDIRLAYGTANNEGLAEVMVREAVRAEAA